MPSSARESHIVCRFAARPHAAWSASAFKRFAGTRQLSSGVGAVRVAGVRLSISRSLATRRMVHVSRMSTSTATPAITKRTTATSQ
jgi:hypothetical protein